MRKKKRRKLIVLQTNTDKRREAIVEIAELLLQDARAGKIRQVFVAWEDNERIVNNSRCSHSQCALHGIVQMCVHGMLHDD